MIVLAIDHGSVSGYSVFKYVDNKVKLVEKGFVRFKSETTYEYMYDEFYPIFRKYEKEAKYIFLEKVNIIGAKFNADAIIRLCEIRAIIKLLAYEHKLNIVEVNPMTLKKHITGNGKATKMEVANEICTMFELDIKDVVPKLHTKKPEFDLTDSIGIGYTGMCKSFNKGNYLEVM